MTSAASSSRSYRPFRWHIRITTLVVAVLGCMATLIMMAPAASALPVTARGFGYLSTGDGGFWLGSWRLADGTLAFCVNTERSTPNGQEYSYADGAALDWYDANDSARLAYISRTWAGTTDPIVAAAGQIATWTITGLGRHTQDELAAKADANASTVRDLARRMLEETEKSASLAVTAALEFALTPDGETTVTPALFLRTLTASDVRVPAGLHRAVVTLSGGTFANGEATAMVANGESTTIRVPTETALAGVMATARFEALPYGKGLRMAVARGSAQNLLTAHTAPVTAGAELASTLPSDRQFQPMVTTRTSASVAEAGASLHDTVVLGVRVTPATVSEWPVFGPPGGPFEPVPVTVRSRLLGPFEGEIELAREPPASAPVVCEVSLLVATGPGEYSTPACTIGGPGRYVWVETISPDDTASTEGGSRILPWSSPFGVATEITTVAVLPIPPASVTPPVVRSLPETGGTVSPVLQLLAVTIVLFAVGTACLACRRKRRLKA